VNKNEWQAQIFSDFKYTSRFAKSAYAMNEEQAVLDFFSQPENLELALIVADHVDEIRQQLNNQFWLDLKPRLDALLTHNNLPWQSELTEDRNNEKCLVGLHVQPMTEHHVFLRPFMEQQLMGDGYRIYHGLMWNTAPEPAQKNLPAVEAIRARLEKSGYKQSDSFLAWQWSQWHPRRSDFLQRFSKQPDELMQVAIQPWQTLLVENIGLLNAANLALNNVPRSAAVSLDSLRSSMRNQTGLS
jgi:hypothetical protein